MNFASFLKENRNQYITHRLREPSGVVDDPPTDSDPPPEEDRSGRIARRIPESLKRRRKRQAYTHVSPAFAPSLLPAPLPYVDPWDRR